MPIATRFYAANSDPLSHILFRAFSDDSYSLSAISGGGGNVLFAGSSEYQNLEFYGPDVAVDADGNMSGTASLFRVYDETGTTLIAESAGHTIDMGQMQDMVEQIATQPGSNNPTTKVDMFLFLYAYASDELNRTVQSTGSDGRDTIEGYSTELDAFDVDGGRGADTFIIYGIEDIVGGAGKDTARFLGGADRGVQVDLEQGTMQSSEHDIPTGTIRGVENLTGSANTDVLLGDGKDNTLRGGNAADTLSGRGGEDVLFGGRGNDLLRGGAANDLLSGGRGNDRVYGGEGRDVLRGGDGSDLILGGKGRDRLFGGNSDDTLDGGKGNDVLVGGSGGDSFVFEAGRSFGDDRIRDYTDADEIVVSGVPEGTESYRVDDGDLIIDLPNGSIRLVGAGGVDPADLNITFDF